MIRWAAAVRRAELVAVLLGGSTALLLCACPADQPSQTPEPQDAGGDALSGDAGVDAAEEPWDPVWHETEPKDWPTIGPEGQPDCGPGCRVAINGDTDNLHLGHTYNTEGVAGVQSGSLLLHALIGSSQTLVYAVHDSAEAATGLAEPYLNADYIVYYHARPGMLKEVYVMSRVTGEKKLVYSFVRKEGQADILMTALNDKYAFWQHDGLGGMMSRNLATGEVKLLAHGLFYCFQICTTDKGIVCANIDTGAVQTIDQETGEVATLDYGGALQTEGACSSDRKQFVWIDYRDPPGQSSTYDFSRSGGEVYMRDLTTDTTTRLTFDSPSSPKGKTYPAIGNGLAVWHETKANKDPNPATAQELYAAADSIVVLDLTTKKKCRIQNDLLQYSRDISIHGRHLYGYWGSYELNVTRLVDLDLDNPAIVCEPY